MSKSKNVLIVGGGLFGCIAAKLAREAGHTVTIFDANEPLAASKASGCLLKPSWLTSIPAEGVERGYEVLRNLYGLTDMVLAGPLIVNFKVQHVSPEAILAEERVPLRVTEVGDGFLRTEDGKRHTGTVLVAAGVWSDRLVDMPKIRWLYGASMRFKGTVEPKINVYAPYRQAISFNLRKGVVWFGDGTSLVEKTWLKEEPQRIQASKDRAAKCFGLDSKPMQVSVGARPFVEGRKGGYFEKLAPRLFVSTGGAKNGTLLAAWQAAQFVDSL